MKNKILQILEKRKSKFQSLKKLISKYDSELVQIIDDTFDDTDNYSEKIYRILNDIDKCPLCKVCNNNIVKFIDFNVGYEKSCSRKCAANNKNRKKKILKTMQEKYDGIGLKSDVIRKKHEKTMLEKHGVKNPGQLCKAKYILRENWYNNFLNEKCVNITPKFNKDYYVNNGGRHFNYEFQCNVCNLDFISYFTNGHTPICPNCNPKPTKSKMEEDLILEIRKFYNGKILRSNRSILKTLEIDILLPDINIGFEMNGTYWHTESNGKDKKYHLNKTELCAQQNIKLIHIFEDDWFRKRDIIINRIKHLLNKSERIYARKCIVKSITSKVSNVFIDQYHIQGKVNSKFRYGLFYNDELVAVMTFCKSRFTKKESCWELLRFVSKCSVVGGASKLLKTFIKEQSPNIIISYADRCWSTGNLYEAIGFNKSHISPPNYWYVKRGIRESRIKYQKHKLSNILDQFDPTLTEWQNMQNNGYDRIWDCGNLVYKMIIT